MEFVFTSFILVNTKWASCHVKACNDTASIWRNLSNNQLDIRYRSKAVSFCESASDYKLAN